MFSFKNSKSPKSVETNQSKPPKGAKVNNSKPPEQVKPSDPQTLNGVEKNIETSAAPRKIKMPFFTKPPKRSDKELNGAKLTAMRAQVHLTKHVIRQRNV